MNPRLTTSHKWTPLPAEFLTQVRSVFKQSFSSQIGRGSVETTGRIYPDEILVRVGFCPENGLKQSHFVVSLGYVRNKDNVLKLLHLAVDAVASLFEQFFAAENDQEFPRLWEEVEFEGRKIYVQYDTVNSQLEAEANRLLGIAQDADLVQGNDSPEEIKARLGITDDKVQDDVD